MKAVTIDSKRPNVVRTPTFYADLGFTLYATSGTGGEKGIGLGLLLCYEFVKANHGNISVSSVEGKGSTFTVVLPGM